MDDLKQKMSGGIEVIGANELQRVVQNFVVRSQADAK